MKRKPTPKMPLFGRALHMIRRLNDRNIQLLQDRRSVTSDLRTAQKNGEKMGKNDAKSLQKMREEKP